MNRLATKRQVERDSAPAKAIWIVLAVLLLIPFLSMAYNDLKSIIHYEVNFMDSILHGGLSNFYDFCYEKANNYTAGQSPATYDFPMYIILGLWGIPLYIYGSLSGLEVTETMGGLVYGKCIYIVALILAAKLIFVICKEIGIDVNEAKWASFLFLSSLLVFTAVCIIGQSDILGIVVILAGILAFVRKQRWKFVLLFMLAVSFKQYGLFVFIPLLLLIEKRVWRILADGGIVLALTGVCNLLFSGNIQGMQEKARFSKYMLEEKLLEFTLPFVGNRVLLVVVLLGILCVYCYMKDPIIDEKEMKQYGIYIPLLVMGILFVSFDANPYWFVHLAPFLSIMLVYNSRYREKLLVFETAGMIALVLGQYIQWHWLFDVHNGKYMLLEKIFGSLDIERASQASISIIHIVNSHPILEVGRNILYSVYFVFLVAVIWYSRPGKAEYIPSERPIKQMAIWRLAANTLIAYIPLVIYVGNFIF